MPNQIKSESKVMLLSIAFALPYMCNLTDGRAKETAFH